MYMKIPKIFVSKRMLHYLKTAISSLHRSFKQSSIWHVICRWYKKEGTRLTSVIDDSPNEPGHHGSMYLSSSTTSGSSRSIQQQHHQHQSSVSSSSFRHDGNSGSSSGSDSSNSNSPSSSSSTSNNNGHSSSSSILARSSGIRLVHGTLIINSVKVSNRGLYLCNVSNSEGSELLEVIFPLTLTNENHFHFSLLYTLYTHQLYISKTYHMHYELEHDTHLTPYICLYVHLPSCFSLACYVCAVCYLLLPRLTVY